MMIVTQLIQNIMLLLVTYILIINNVTCLIMERGTTAHDPRSGDDAVFNIKDDITSSSSRPLCSRGYSVNEQKEFNCQSMATVRAVYAKYSTIQECMTLERSPIQLNEETLIFGFINRIRELEGNVYQLKDEKDAIIYEKQAKVQVLQNNINSLQEILQLEKEKLNGEIETKDSLIEEHIGKERKYKEETDAIIREREAKIQFLQNNINSLQEIHQLEKEKFKGEIQTKDSLIEEHIGKERKYKEETDVITHENEAKIQALQNNIKSLQEGHQIVKENFKAELQNKDSVIEEHIAKEKKCKEENESLEKENRDLQDQIKTLKKHVIDKDIELQRHLPRKEGTWKKYSGGGVPEDGVVANDSGGYKDYVGRAEVDGDVVPGWIWPSLKVCVVYHNGEQHNESPYEVLVPNSSFEWISCHGDDIPPRAVPGGKTKEGEVLYVGRIRHTDGYYYVGKVQPSLNGCYNRHPLVHPRVDGDFTIHPNYQILVWK